MILGRTPEGLIKIKTDGGLRAVNCACCVTCCPLPNSIKGKKFAVTSVSWSSIVSFSTMDACGNFSAQTADGYSIFIARANTPPPECIWDGLWLGQVYNGGPIPDYPCTLLSSFIYAVNPVGTHPVIDDFGPPASGCDDWTLTISEVP
jgi:hypothetical protein